MRALRTKEAKKIDRLSDGVVVGTLIEPARASYQVGRLGRQIGHLERQVGRLGAKLAALGAKLAVLGAMLAVLAAKLTTWGGQSGTGERPGALLERVRKCERRSHRFFVALSPADAAKTTVFAKVSF